MNITWVYPEFLLLIPLLFLLFLVRRSHHVRSQVARPKVKHLLASPSGVSKAVETGTTAKRVTGWFGLIALCLAATAMARPQWGEIEQRTYERSREVVIALDLSRSMLATDVAPSRLERAKLLVDSLIKELDGERIGLVVFAGTSFVQYPLSNDYEVLRDMLKEVNPSFLPQQGTDFGKLLQTAYKAFDFTSNSDRFLIVLSDGEDLAGDWDSELKQFQDNKIHIISLGIGTAAGSVLPEEGGGVIKDEKGAVVLSRLDTKVLQELATRTGGRYVDAYRWVDLSKTIAETVDQGEKGEFAKKQQILKVERFQLPLGLALLFAFLSLWRDFPVYPKHSIKKPSTLEKSLDKHARRKGGIKPISTPVTLLLLLILPLSAQEMPSPKAGAEPKPEEKLSGTVQVLSSMDNLSATDYARFAEATIGYGKAMQQAKGNIEMGAIDDALMGVDEGEAMDAKAADWPKLRKELEELKKKSSDQDQKKQDQKKQDQKDKNNKDNKDQNKDQKQDQQKQNSGGSGNQDKDKDKQQQGQDSKSDQGQGKDQKQDQKNQQGQGQGQDPKNQDSKNPQSGQNGQDPNQQKQPSQGQDQPKDGKDPKDPNSQQNQGQNPKDDKDKKEGQDPSLSNSQGSPDKKDTETKKVGGGGSSGQNKEKEDATDAEGIEMARKIDQIKQKDSPGRIYQLFTPQEPSPVVKGKTW